MINLIPRANLNLISSPPPRDNFNTLQHVHFQHRFFNYHLEVLRELREEFPNLPRGKACCVAVASQRFMRSIKCNPCNRVTRVAALVLCLNVRIATRPRILCSLRCTAVELDKFVTNGLAAGQGQHVVIDAMLAVVRDWHRTPSTAAEECTREDGDCAELGA